MSNPKKKSEQNRPKKSKKAEDDLERYRQKMSKLDGFENAKIVRSEDMGHVSMSDVFSEFVAPFRQFVETDEDFKKLHMIAAIAWNATLLPAEKRESMLEQFRQTLPGKQAKSDFDHSIEDFIWHKQHNYPEYRRMILEFEFTADEDEYHLNVVSTIEDIPE